MRVSFGLFRARRRFILGHDDNAFLEARNQDRLLLILKFYRNLRGFLQGQQLVQESARQPPGTRGSEPRDCMRCEFTASTMRPVSRLTLTAVTP